MSAKKDDPKKTLKKILDVASNASSVGGLVLDTGVTGGGLALGKLLLVAVEAGASARKRRKAEEYLSLLAESLSEEDTIALAATLDSAGEHPAWDAVELGFQSVMSALDETSKKCVALLVADYAISASTPDREFQLIGNLLSSCDEPLLRILHAISCEFGSCTDYAPIDSDTISFCVMRCEENRGDEKEMFVRCYRSSSIPVDSDGAAWAPETPTVLHLLERYELGALPPQMSSESGGDYKHSRTSSRELYIRRLHMPRIARLSRYLAPVFYLDQSWGDHPG